MAFVQRLIAVCVIALLACVDASAADDGLAALLAPLGGAASYADKEAAAQTIAASGDPSARAALTAFLDGAL